MKHIHAASILAALSLAALPALAGVKYWDNPDFKAFDVGDYVQDGLVVNYDGIRNAGPDAPHDSAAMTWVNSANPGTYDMTRYSTNGTVGASKTATVAAWNNDAAHGSWTDRGFVFDKDSAFHQPSSFAIPKTYTIQSLVDATPGNQPDIGYIMCDYNAAHWAYCSLGIRNTNYNYGGGNVLNTMYLVSGSIGKRPAVRGASGAPFTYVTAINNVNDGVTFTGTNTATPTIPPRQARPTRMPTASASAATIRAPMKCSRARSRTSASTTAAFRTRRCCGTAWSTTPAISGASATSP